MGTTFCQRRGRRIKGISYTINLVTWNAVDSDKTWLSWWLRNIRGNVHFPGQILGGLCLHHTNETCSSLLVAASRGAVWRAAICQLPTRITPGSEPTAAPAEPTTLQENTASRTAHIAPLGRNRTSAWIQVGTGETKFLTQSCKYLTRVNLACSFHFPLENQYKTRSCFASCRAPMHWFSGSNLGIFWRGKMGLIYHGSCKVPAYHLLSDVTLWRVSRDKSIGIKGSIK